MPIKRQPSELELNALADHFRGLWRQGDVIRPWLRKHQEMIRDLVYDDFSWAAVAEALTRAGITWRTGRPWSAEGLRREIVRATVPLKKRRRLQDAPPAVLTAPAAGAATAPQAAADRPAPAQAQPVHHVPTVSGIQATSAEASVPKFKPATLKPYEPPRRPSPDEEADRNALHKRIFG